MLEPRRLSISLARPSTGPGFFGQASVPGSVTNLPSLRKCHSSQVETDGLAQQLLPGFLESQVRTEARSVGDNVRIVGLGGLGVIRFPEVLVKH